MTLSDLINKSISISCPTPFASSDIVRLGHGSGGRMTSELIENIFLPELGNPILNKQDDAALVVLANQDIAVTVDSYVVNPIFFPGGDIGSLAVHGTINDLAMRGAKPIFLTASFILEEGLAFDDLRRIVHSMKVACEIANVQLIAGDTKVVNRGAADKLFISTSGIGLIKYKNAPAAERAQVGDCLIVSGELGQHGMAIMCAREGLELETVLESDSAPLFDVVNHLLQMQLSIHCLRDLTRGGLSSALNELAVSSHVSFEIDEAAIPIHPQVKAACEILGLDPLYVACEGRFVAILPEDQANLALQAMRSYPCAAQANVVGRVVNKGYAPVILNTAIGGKRILDKLSGEQLPRIC